MEARFLQEHLERTLGRNCFLDSDDLLNLQELKAAVLASDVLILIQSREVLTRPWCVLELITAIEHKVPIVGVNLTTGKHPFDFEAAGAFLRSLDTELEARNPGASAILEQNGIALDDATWKLSSTLPGIISIAFNPSASRNVLSASVADIVGAMQRSKPVEPQMARDEWQAQRAAQAARIASAVPEPTAAAAGSPAPAAAAAAAAAIEVAASPGGRGLASIPPEVPGIPAAMQPRPQLLSALKRNVLSSVRGVSPDDEAKDGLAIVGAPRQAASTTTAHGMGGVGKTCMAATLLRDPEVGAAFEKLLWVTVGQQPDLLQLLRVLHLRLTGAKLPPSVDVPSDALDLLTKKAVGVRALLCLDDIWQKDHADALNFVDADVGAVVITTRIRSMAQGQGGRRGFSSVSCDVLSTSEAVSLLLASAGLDELAEPPPAALKAVSLCGNLPLALPIAGAMIRELEGSWETLLVPMLEEELSEELSMEERVVAASLRCVDASQRAGVEAAFEVCAIFPEDALIPAAVFDVIAPLVCTRAGLDLNAIKQPHLKVRRFMAQLLSSSLVSGSLDSGVSVHDLVRDVMIDRVERAAEGGALAKLQREAIELLLSSYTEAAPAAAYITTCLYHHISQSFVVDGGDSDGSSGAVLTRPDLVRALGHADIMIIRQAATGIGADRLHAQIALCEEAGQWWETAQLWFAMAIRGGRGAGHMLGHALNAVGRVKPETADSRFLEVRAINIAMWHAPTGTEGEAVYKHGSPEHNALVERAVELGKQANEEGASSGAEVVSDDEANARSEALYALAATLHLQALQAAGGTDQYVPTEETALKVYEYELAAARTMVDAGGLTRDARRKECCLQLAACYGACFSVWHQCCPGYDQAAFCGPDGELLRTNIKGYSFANHTAHKASLAAIDSFLFGQNEHALLLWYGDLPLAREAWAQQVDAWQRIRALIDAGKTSWSDCFWEYIWATIMVSGSILAARDLEMLAKWAPCVIGSAALSDPAVHDECKRAQKAQMFCNWEKEDGTCGYRVQTLQVQARGLAALAAAGDAGFEGGALADEEEAAALRGWLPSPDDLIWISHHEHLWLYLGAGAAHPSLLCARLYGARLGEWAQASEIVEKGILALADLALCPLTTIEAWRLLARCADACGEAERARNAREKALAHSQRCGYVWMERAVEEEMAAEAPVVT